MISMSLNSERESNITITFIQPDIKFTIVD